GYLEWQAKQDRTELVRQLQEEGADLSAMAKPETINRHLSVVLTAELAKAVRNLTENSADPDELAKSLAHLVGRFAQLRREESNASRAEMAREQWDQEVTRREHNERVCSALMPLQALSMQQTYIDMFRRCDAQSLAAANELALDLAQNLNTFPASSSKTESD
ncbi:MAG TPA: hypothetical protein VGI88_06425, partial [Verrucomicrobiae bacterium]